MISDVIDSLAVIGGLSLFCCAVFLVLLLSADDEPEGLPTDGGRSAALYAEIDRLRRHNVRLTAKVYRTLDERDAFEEEVALLNEALTEQVRRDQCKAAHPAGGRSLDPRNLAPWHGEN